MRWLVRSAFAVVAALTACSGSPVGRSFAAEGEIVEALGDGVVLGRFDLAYPARVERIESGAGGIRFVHEGTPHAYQDIAGAVHAVFVEHRKGRGVLVVRSGES